jgi:predicted HTH transcriptional regulator
VRKITKEIAAMLNTRRGGIIFYGVDDNGKVHGADFTRQQFDQPLHNSVRNSINPAAVVALRSVNVMGSDILIVIVPPWNGSDVYMFEEKVLLRRGTNTFAAKPEELRKLFRGEAIV